MSRIQVTIENQTYYASKNDDGTIIVGESNDGGKTYTNDTIYTVNSSGSAVGNGASSSSSNSSSIAVNPVAAESVVTTGNGLQELIAKEIGKKLENDGIDVIEK